jgi:hypothetical protein
VRAPPRASLELADLSGSSWRSSDAQGAASASLRLSAAIRSLVAQRSPEGNCMAIRFRCPTTNRTLRVNEDFQGKRVRCPACGEVHLVPTRRVSPSPADSLSEDEALGFLQVPKPLTAKPPQPREVVPSASADFAVPTKQQGGTDSETSQAFNEPLLAPPASLPAKARERALKAVRGPARGLIVTCVLNILVPRPG